LKALIAIALLSLVLASMVPAGSTDTPTQLTTISSLSHTGGNPKQSHLHRHVPFQVILRNEFGHGPTGVTEINDEESWSLFWNTLAPCFSAQCAAPPSVDFTHLRLLVVAPGEEGNPGYQINVIRVLGSKTNIRVGVNLVTPGLYCVYAQVITFPIEVIGILKTSLPANLEISTTQAPACSI
jgi:hypothetical protein